MKNVTFLGTTTLRRMISVAFDENDPLRNRNTYAECFAAKWRLEENPNDGDEVVYVYYHPKKDETIMTNIEGDLWGAMGSSAGFEGKMCCKDFCEKQSLAKMPCCSASAE